MVERIMTIELDRQTEEDQITRLVAAARQDPKVFGQLYLLFAQPVFRYLYSRTGSVPEAEDLTAQTFLNALERFPSYRHKGFFASWLFSMAHNKAVDYFRHNKKHTPMEAMDSIPAETNVLHQVIQTERVLGLTTMIHSLAEREQELIRLRYMADLSFAEIGQLLGQKEDTVKKTLYRLLARLKIQLEDSHV
jgi:RNA polymerase sigma-70 factor (ECF subfamily)